MAVAVVLLTVVTAMVAVALWPRTQVSDLYRRYEHSDHVEATFLRNYPVNDTLTVPVTLLQASDSIGWADMIVDIIQDGSREDFISEDLFFRLILREGATPQDVSGSYIIAARRDNKSVGIFHLENMVQYNAIMQIYFNSLKTN